jgi:4-carboxymuconolactone decarboxylase
MARLPYVEPGASAAADALYAEIQRMGRPVLNLYKEVANQPPALAAFLEMSRYVRAGSSLGAGLRELAILATAHAVGQDYEVTHHTEAAVRAGVSAEKLEAVAHGGSLDVLTPAERGAVEFARQVAHSRTCDDATFARLQELFSTEEIVDVVLTTGWYHLCAVILGSLRIEIEAESR